MNYTYSISWTGNTGLQQRLQHAPTGRSRSAPTRRAYETLNNNLAPPHVLKANAVWDTARCALELRPRRRGPAQRLAGVRRVHGGGPGTPYDLTYSYQNNGSSKNLTGSPDYGAQNRVSSATRAGAARANQYAQFNRAAVTGPGYNSVGLESGRNIMAGCADHTTDLAIVRNIQVGGARQLQFRLDAFNAFNAVGDQRPQNQIQFNSPTDLTIRNSQFLADGSR